MPEGTIRRSVQLAIEGGNVFVQDVTIAGKKAEDALKKVGDGASSANDNLERTAKSAEGFSRAGRFAFANLGNQIQDFVVQVQGGTDGFRAFAQQAPQALDAFSSFIPALPLIGAGIAIVSGVLGPVIERMFNFGGALKEATADAAAHKQQLDALSSSFGISAENAQKYQAGLKVLTDQEKDLLNVDLRSTIQADQQQLESLASQIKSTARGLTSAAEIPDIQAPGGSATIPLAVSDPELANLREYAKSTRELIDNWQLGKGTFTEVTDALERLSIMTGESDRTRAKEIDGLKEEVEQQEAAKRAIDTHTAQYHLLLQELGETNAFTEADRVILNHNEVIKEATQALLTLGTANRMNVIEGTSALIAKTDPQAAEQYRTQKIDELAKLTKSLQDAADRNVIRLRTGLDVGDAEKLRSQLDAAGKKLSGTLDEDIKNIKAAGDALVSTGADANKMQAAENELIREAIDKRKQVAAAALKEREEQALITAGLAKSKEQADQLLASNNNVLTGLTGSKKLEEEINRLYAERAILSGPEEAERRETITRQIAQLETQRSQVLKQEADTAERQAAAALKEREERALINAGIAKTKQEADALLASNNNVLTGLTGQAKITAEINRLIAERATLSGPEEADRRANIDTQINNLQKERNDLVQKDVDKQDKYIQQGDKVIEQLKTQLEYKSAANQITEADIKAAGEAAAAKVPPVPPDLARGPNGDALQRQYEERKRQAQELGEAAKTEEFWTKAAVDDNEMMNSSRQAAIDLYNKLLPPQESYQEQLQKLQPLLEGTAEDQEKGNKAIERLRQLQPILERQNQIRERNAEIDRLTMSNNPVDWFHAGFLEVQNEAEDTGRSVASSLKSGLDSENHAFFELVAGQKQGWADMKSAALDFVATLGEVALKQLEIMAISRTIGFIGGLFGGVGGGTTASMQTSGGSFVNSSDIMSVYDLHAGGFADAKNSSPRYVSTSAIPYLPRFHAGGLSNDERVIIVQTGEQILNREETRDYHRARRMHDGGMVDEGGSSYQRSPSQVIYSPTTNNYFSGVQNEEHTAAVIKVSSEKANRDFVRMTRNSPDFRRAMGR